MEKLGRESYGSYRRARGIFSMEEVVKAAVINGGGAVDTKREEVMNEVFTTAGVDKTCTYVVNSESARWNVW